MSGNSLGSSYDERSAARVAELEDAIRRIYMWVSPPALKEDEDTSLVEARRICREALGMTEDDGGVGYGTF